MTAVRSIAVITMIKSVFTLIGDLNDVPIIVKLYEESLADIVGVGFMHSSFSMLAKYWQDPSCNFI